MSETAKAACIVGVALILASVIHGGFYSAVPAPNRGDRPGLVYIVNKYTGEAVKWCVPRGCGAVGPVIPDFAR